jgi:hypothetical protein
MFKVLKVDGPNIVTDKGCVCISGFQYADGGKTHSVSDEDSLEMRSLFLASPAMLKALTDIRDRAEALVQECGSAILDHKLKLATIFRVAADAINEVKGK